ncbi:hypothetical protein GT347_08805 [Xylophilus rhododendri]|uniref:Lipoprotein n=1 Tax=Xylophilus rhododendri TaxID=2697032 RepID=A0A857J5H4_9BURK|nr:hypothetical protein [Xylophilus rhododendri]QHI98085.1 hypothetical protein GT347_08805 [Xylophilus rhododendri]
MSVVNFLLFIFRRPALGLLFALCGCESLTAPLGQEAKNSDPPVFTPSGYERQKSVICMQERRKTPNKIPLTPRRFSIPVEVLMPKTPCLELQANGQLVEVPGQCGLIPREAKSCD